MLLMLCLSSTMKEPIVYMHCYWFYIWRHFYSRTCQVGGLHCYVRLMGWVLRLLNIVLWIWLCNLWVWVVWGWFLQKDVGSWQKMISGNYKRFTSPAHCDSKLARNTQTSVAVHSNRHHNLHRPAFLLSLWSCHCPWNSNSQTWKRRGSP